MTLRKTAAAGGFYPGEPNELKALMGKLDELLNSTDYSAPDKTPYALVVPHAGYIFSGFTANAAYKSVPQTIKDVVVIGPSHRVYLKGASVADYDEYETPLGNLTINSNLATSLQKEYEYIGFEPAAHAEHSTETQMPFIKRALPEAEVTEIVYGDISSDKLARLIEKLADKEDRLIVISSDLSHFYNLKEATKLDSICLDSIAALNTDIERSGCEACGILGIAALIKHAKKHNRQSEILDYRTSSDMSGDTSSVVGYTSAVFY
jgi:AmmeMemoRadiSam system protein B